MSTILIVDDAVMFRAPIAASLRAAGHQTLTAGDGREALALARAHRPDLILLDLAMPDMDGLAFLRERRGDEHLGRIPVILLTAMAERDHAAEASQLGVCGYLLKSQFSMKDLVARVSELLGRPEEPMSPR